MQIKTITEVLSKVASHKHLLLSLECMNTSSAPMLNCYRINQINYANKDIGTEFKI